ncbi:MAG: YihA family ribosome biogenesis GTP-binding protein [Firmicutes bacterium]|nr:YihA family ribosome biogenesis GTP-binding protein [Bacillota bacterium]
MIKIRKASLAQSAVKPAQYVNDDLPQIVLLGRSNAGKSSLINCVINRKGLARTSSSPGKTRLINFYLIEAQRNEEIKSFYIVDLPGYGYAKVAKTERDSWLAMISRFLKDKPEQKFLYQLLDIRHDPSFEDREMNKALTEAGYGINHIAAKADKVSKNEKARNAAKIRGEFCLEKDELIVFSAVSREGRERLLADIEEIVFGLLDAKVSEMSSEVEEAVNEE